MKKGLEMALVSGVKMGAKKIRANSVVLSLTLAFGLLAADLIAQQDIIEDIRIRGNRRVPEDTIRFYIQLRPGDPFDMSRLQADYQALVKLRSFENVMIDVEDGARGKIITFIFKEYPLIRSIEYVGNKSFSQSDILEHYKNKKISLTVDSQYDPAKIIQAQRALYELLEKNGKPLGTVKHELEEVTETSVKIKFIIDEGPKVRIGKIDFVGNTVFSDEKLKDALKLTKERGFVSALRGRDKYEKMKLEYDLETNVRKLYQEHGYLDVRIGEPKAVVKEGPRGLIPLFRKTKQQYFIEIPIVEGEQYRVGQIQIKNSEIEFGGQKLFPPDKLVQVFRLNKGDVLNMTKIRDGLEQIKKAYTQLGYIDWQYIPEQNVDREKRIVDFTFVFEPGKQYRVNRIEFAGNTKTRDKVLRREFMLEEQAVYNSNLLELSILRLNQLGFFEKIEEKDYEVKPNSNNATVDILVKVKERGQQSIGLTGGTSGLSGSFVGVSYMSNNFRGKGQSVAIDITWGTRTTNFMFSFTDPYFRDSKVSMGFSIFNQRLRFDTFNTFGFFGGVLDFRTGRPFELFTRKTSGIQLSASYPLWSGFWRTGASYTIQNIAISDISKGLEPFALGTLAGFTPSLTGKEALKGIVRSQVTPTLTYNTSDHPLDPKRGTRMTLSAAIAGGPLGGNISLFQPTFEWAHFVPDRWLSGRRNTLAFRALLGFVTGFGGSSVPLFDRYFSGGETTVRGFDIRSIGPYAIISTPQVDDKGQPIVDPNTGVQNVTRTIFPIGGDTLINGNFEYRIPIAGPLSLAAFFDVGTSRITRRNRLGDFGSSVVILLDDTNTVWRTSTGLEVLFMLPVVNVPFRLIFAYNPNILDTMFPDLLMPGIFHRAREPRRNIQFTVGRAF